MYETSTEVMQLNESWGKKIDFREVIGKMIDPNSEKPTSESEIAAEILNISAIDRLKDLLPKLNETFIEVVKEISNDP